MAVTEGGRVPLLIGAVLMAGVVPSFALVTYAEKAEVARTASRLWEGRVIAQMLMVLTNRDFSVLILLFALLGILDWFLWGAALGSPPLLADAVLAAVASQRKAMGSESLMSRSFKEAQ
jgi:hypothetical protein